MKIGLFGGTFDPIHNGHIEIARKALDMVDLVVFVPSGIPPHKSNVEMATHRLNMVRLGVSNRAGFLVSDFEIKSNCVNYSVRTIKHFSKLYKGDQIYFIIGDDAYKDIHTWRDYEQLNKLCTFIVFRRTGVTLPSSAIFIDNETICVSSSHIRERIKRHQCVEDMLPAKVLEYIISKGLYSEE